MAKERIFKFTDITVPEEEQVKEVTATSYAKQVEVEWTTKRGEEFYTVQKLPMGRSKKIGK